MIDLSILIPTRARPDTFEHAFATALAQDHPVEIVVQNNGADPATRAIVEAAGDRRVVYAESAELLPMTENWEAGLRRCSGRYLTVLGDDDGLLADAAALAMQVAAAFGEPEVIAWTPPDYGWPSVAEPGLRNRLILGALAEQVGAEHYESGLVLAALYAGQISVLAAPSIYSAVVHRRLVETACARWGRYFATALPDVHSAVVNLHLTRTFVRLNRPLSVRGSSGNSIGAAFFHDVSASGPRAEFERATAAAGWDPLLPPSTTLELVIANALLGAKALLFPGADGPSLDLGGVAAQVMQGLARGPDAYDRGLADLERLAAQHGLALDPGRLPPRPATGAVARGGLQRGADGAPKLVVNGDHAGIRTIADAVRIARAVLADWR